MDVSGSQESECERRPAAREPMDLVPDKAGSGGDPPCRLHNKRTVSAESKERGLGAHGNEVFSAHVTMLGCKYCCTYRRGFCHIFRVRRGRDKANEQAEWPRGENVSRRRRGKKQRGRASLVGPGPAPPASPRAARDLPTTGGSAQGSGEGLALWLGAPAMSGFGVDGSSELGRARSSRARVGRDDIGAELLFPHEPVTRLPSHPLG